MTPSLHPSPAHRRPLLFSSLALALLSASLKLLLFPAPASTDLQVHRHWKALTHTLPLARWYSDTSSTCTLDYPPLFAYFERLLALLLRPLHPPLLALANHNYSAHPVLPLLRLTVLATDPLLLLASLAYARALAAVPPLAPPSAPPSAPSLPTPHPELYFQLVLSAALVLLLPGLSLVDNVHFQYNALPLAALLLALAALPTRPACAAVLLSLALNLKHTFLPLAAPFAVYFFATLSPPRPASLLRLFVATVATFLAIWAPLYFASPRAPGHALRRLFPFHRGLLHIYWAPNFWALYAALDKLLRAAGLHLRRVDLDPARGLIGAQRPFAVLPNPTPLVCATLVAIALTPPLCRLWREPRAVHRAAPLAALAAFVFGWHIHEKAVLVPLALLAAYVGARRGSRGRADVLAADAFLWLSVAGQFALFPLVTTPTVAAYKVAHFVGYEVLAFGAVGRGEGHWRKRWGVVAYALGTAFVEAYAGVGGGHWRVFGERMPFVPLIVMSVYCAAGVLVAFCKSWASCMEAEDAKDKGDSSEIE